MENVKIIIADDHVLFIEGLKHLLENESRISILQTAHDGKALMDILMHTKPDIILMDINMPALNGLEATRFISQSYREIKVIILSTYDERHMIEKARQNGAKAYMLKNCNKEELVNTILSVQSGNMVFSAGGNHRPDPFNEEDKFMKQYKISRRELEVIQCIKQNLTNQEIATKLFLSIYTVETHRKNIMNKLGIKKTAALINFTIEHNL